MNFLKKGKKCTGLPPQSTFAWSCWGNKLSRIYSRRKVLSDAYRSLTITPGHPKSLPLALMYGQRPWSLACECLIPCDCPWRTESLIEEVFQRAQTMSCCWWTTWRKALTYIGTLGHRHRTPSTFQGKMLLFTRQSFWRMRIQLLVEATMEKFTFSPSKPRNVPRSSATELPGRQFRSLMCVAYPRFLLTNFAS